MAYPNYFPATYNPYGYYQPSYPQIQQQQPAQPQQQGQSGIIWVGSEQEAVNYPIVPNSAIAFWDSTRPSIYLKQSDASGKPTIKTYDLVERKPAPPKVDQEPVEYATKNDLIQVAGVVKGYEELIGTIRSDLENIKTEFYGKRTTRKKEEETA